ELFDDAVFAFEGLGVDGVVANFGGAGFVLAGLQHGAFFVGRAGAEDHWPVGPGHFGRALLGGLGEKLELGDAGRALAMGGAQAVSAGVAAAEDDHVLAFGGDEIVVGDVVAEVALVLQGQV